MKTGRERLISHQTDLYDKGIEVEKHKISLFEAPTGFGKSVIIDTIAETLALRGKKIIIATPTNQLAIELLDLFKNNDNFSFDETLLVDIVVGKGNYFDIDNFSSEVYEYINKDEVLKYFQSIVTNEDYLIEKLFDSIEIEEPNKKIVQEMISAKKQKEFMKDFSENNISITNFAFLLTNVFHVKDFDISQYVVIADEVHQLLDSAENLLTNSFSLFRYRNITNQLLNQLKKCENVDKKTVKLLKSQNEALSGSLNKHSNESKAGDYYVVDDKNKELSVIADIKRELFEAMPSKSNKTESLSLQAKLHKSLLSVVKENKCQLLAESFKLYSSERNEMLGVIGSPQDVTVYLSPSRGYPTLNAAKGDVRGWMLSYFWDKVESFIGLSATIKTSEEDTSSFVTLGISRGTFEQWLDRVESIVKFSALNMRLPHQDDEGFERLASFIETQRKGYIEGWIDKRKKDVLIEKLGVGVFFGLEEGVELSTRKENREKVEHIKYGVETYEPVFKKSQARVFIPSKDLIEPQTQGGEQERQWFEMNASTIAKNFENKNTMVICGSFYEVDNLYVILKGILPDTNILFAQKNTPTAQTIARFKKEGGILIGTRNYGVGVNLPGSELEKLFIVKLPFPIFTTKKWLDIKERDKKFKTSFYYSSYKNAMITSFRQWIGRLIRSKTDKADLYILDSRYNNTKYNGDLLYWLERMGEVQEEMIVYLSNECLVRNTSSNNVFQIINSLGCEQDIKDFLVEKIEDILTYKKLPIPLDEKVYSKDFRDRFRVFRKANDSLFSEIL